MLSGNNTHFLQVKPRQYNLTPKNVYKTAQHFAKVILNAAKESISRAARKKYNLTSIRDETERNPSSENNTKVKTA